MNRWFADRLGKLPPYLFVEIDRRKQEAIAAGRDVIDFGVGDPDLPTPKFIIDRMEDAIRDPRNHRYSLGVGMMEFRRSVAAFFGGRFGVRLDPATEVVGLLGAKEGIGHLAFAVVNPGDVVLVPEPGYPVYESGTVLAGGRCHTMPLSAERGFLPDLEQIPPEVRRRARLMWLNYPNNPTGACASLPFFREVIRFAKQHDILVAHDTPYSEVYFGDPPPSILQVEGAAAIAVEFHSFSKTFDMTGWRLGFAVGNAQVLAALAKVKSNLDSGVFQAIQQAGIAALSGIGRPEIRKLIDTYRGRRNDLLLGLNEAGWKATAPNATFYLWVKCPAGGDSMTVTRRLLDEADVVVIPGAGFGPSGEGFVRFALTVTGERTREAVDRIQKLRW